jgi:DNA-binding transcriptional regulator YhcF (GntR family)
MKEKGEFFAQVTDAYIENALSLGYTSQEVLNYLQERLSRCARVKKNGGRA